MACSTVLLQPATHNLPPRMKVHSFKGDNHDMVDRLIAASQRKEVSFDTLQERPLVPFFDSSDASATSFQALQPGGRHAPASLPVPVPQHGLKRAERSSGQLAGSPPKKENEVLQAKHRRGKPSASGGHGAAAGSGSDTEMRSAAPPRKKGGKKSKAAPAAPAGAQRQSHPRKRPEPALDMRALAAASAGAALRTPGAKGKAAPAPLKFAGPAFTNSPTPDCLPIPTSSLLLQDAADGLRSRLTL